MKHFRISPSPRWPPTLAPAARPRRHRRPTDAQIAAIVVTANQVDIDAGHQCGASRTPTDVRDVKTFATLMVTDHTAVNKAATDLAGRLHLTPEDNATAQSLKKGGEDNVAHLKTLSGAAFDRAYVDHEVAYHEAVLSALDTTLIPNATNADLKALMVKVRPAFVALPGAHAEDAAGASWASEWRACDLGARGAGSSPWRRCWRWRWPPRARRRPMRAAPPARRPASPRAGRRHRGHALLARDAGRCRARATASPGPTAPFVPHTVTARDGSFDSKAIPAGATFTWVPATRAASVANTPAPTIPTMVATAHPGL